MCIWIFLLLLFTLFLCGRGDYLSDNWEYRNFQSYPTCRNYNQADSCETCLQIDNAAWCSTGQCLIFNKTADSCRGNCSSSLSQDKNSCSPLVLNIIALIFSFILLIVCPLCVLGACFIIIIARCRSYNKILADVQEASIGPIPVLQLSNTATSLPGDPQPMMIADARILHDHEAQDILTFGEGYAQPIGTIARYSTSTIATTANGPSHTAPVSMGYMPLSLHTSSASITTASSPSNGTHSLTSNSFARTMTTGGTPMIITPQTSLRTTTHSSSTTFAAAMNTGTQNTPIAVSITSTLPPTQSFPFYPQPVNTNNTLTATATVTVTATAVPSTPLSTPSLRTLPLSTTLPHASNSYYVEAYQRR